MTVKKTIIWIAIAKYITNPSTEQQAVSEVKRYRPLFINLKFKQTLK